MGPGTITVIALLLAAALPAAAQPNRIHGRIDAAHPVALKNHVHPGAQRQFDQGPVDPAFVMDGLGLLLAPSPAQQAELDAYLAALQDSGSPDYRNWLTPAQFAERFAVSAGDLDQITAWLTARGFTIRTVAPSRNWVAFSGTAGQVQQTFQAEIHRFEVEGALHFSNTADPTVPAALDGVVTAISGLHDFGLRPPQPNLAPGYTAGSGNHYVAPADLATIYNLNGLAANGYDGTGQKLAIVGQSAVDLNDIRNFRSIFGLPAKDPQIVLVPGGPDPGIVSGDVIEADLDLEWAGAAARNASLIYVYSANVMDALQYAVTQNLAPVIAMSYGGCETASGASMRAIAQQANAQGITWIASSGDSGAAGCESAKATTARQGLAVLLPASIPEVTGVGGTTFVEGSGTYWGTNNASLGSALSYIPETSWNDTTSRRLAASGGGASKLFGKPGWQAGQGVPADNARDVPDLAMLASPQHDGAILCTGGSCANGLGSTFNVVGGTSLAAPVFAGITTLLNQYLVGTGIAAQAGLGNINPALYGLAQTSTDIFHDVTTGNNNVPCRPGSPNCSAGNIGYQAGPGYDQVTGLGSVNAGNLVAEWQNYHPAPAALSSVTISPATVGGGATATLTVALTSAAPATGASVMLSSTSAAFPVPASVTVPAGQFSASLQVQTTAVTASTPATVTATYNSVTKTANVTVAPVVLPTLSSVAVTPSTIAGGAFATVTVTLGGPAPLGGAAVTLLSNASAFPLPASLTVPAGRLIASTTVQTTAVTASTPVTVTAAYNGASKTANATLTPVVLPALASLTISPASVPGGSAATLTIALSGPAPAGGASVTLAGNAAAFPVPASVTVSAGRSSATVSVQTKTVTASTPVTVTATYNGASKTANATLTPVVLPALASISVSPATVNGGGTTILTVTLTGPAPPGGASITLSSSNTAALQLPSPVLMPAGYTSGRLRISAGRVTTATTVTITAGYNGSSQTTKLTVNPGSNTH
jgi:hypothetical protein